MLQKCVLLSEIKRMNTMFNSQQQQLPNTNTSTSSAPTSPSSQQHSTQNQYLAQLQLQQQQLQQELQMIRATRQETEQFVSKQLFEMQQFLMRRQAQPYMMNNVPQPQPWNYTGLMNSNPSMQMQTSGIFNPNGYAPPVQHNYNPTMNPVNPVNPNGMNPNIAPTGLPTQQPIQPNMHSSYNFSQNSAPQQIYEDTNNKNHSQQ